MQVPVDTEAHLQQPLVIRVIESPLVPMLLTGPETIAAASDVIAPDNPVGRIITDHLSIVGTMIEQNPAASCIVFGATTLVGAVRLGLRLRAHKPLV